MLEFVGLHKSFGDNHVLDGVGFTVAPGSMFGFVGANGAGQDHDDADRARGASAPTPARSAGTAAPLDADAARRIGYMPEERGLYPKMKVGEQLAYFARLHGLDAGGGRARPPTLGRAARPRRAPRRPGREAVAGQPAARPARRRARRTSRRCSSSTSRSPGSTRSASTSLAEALLERAARGVPVVFSSHQLELVERLCDAVGILARGRIVASGTVEELRAGRPGGCCASSSRTPRRTGPASCPASASSRSRPATPSSSSPTGPTTRPC